MQKTKYFTCFYYSILFFFSKRCKFNTLFHYENKQQNRIGKYQDFRKIYRECTKETYSFLTTDTKLPASDPLRFRKTLFDSYKNDNN